MEISAIGSNNNCNNNSGDTDNNTEHNAGGISKAKKHTRCRI